MINPHTIPYDAVLSNSGTICLLAGAHMTTYLITSLLSELRLVSDWFSPFLHKTYYLIVTQEKMALCTRLPRPEQTEDIRDLTHWKPFHDINCAHLGTGPLLKFNGIVY